MIYNSNQEMLFKFTSQIHFYTAQTLLALKLEINQVEWVFFG